MTSEEHNKYISWAFLANGLFQLLMLGFVLVFMYFWLSFGPGDDRGFPPELLALILGFAGIINLIILAPNFVAAYAISTKKPWARIAGIVGAALAAMNVPIGTLAAVYSLWYFCGEQWKEVYPETAGKSGQRQFGGMISPGSEREGSFDENEGAFVHRTPPPPDWR